jgi:hypothetical protein
MNVLTAKDRGLYEYALNLAKRPSPRAVAELAGARYVRLDDGEARQAHVIGRLDGSRTRCGLRVRNAWGRRWAVVKEPLTVCSRCAKFLKTGGG